MLCLVGNYHIERTIVMTRYLSNAFSLNMLDLQPGDVQEFTCEAISLAKAEQLVRTAVSVIGHASTAAVVGDQLGLPVETNRVNVKLSPGDELIVAQYKGPRLEEGVTELPQGAEITYILVTH